MALVLKKKKFSAVFYNFVKSTDWTMNRLACNCHFIWRGNEIEIRCLRGRYKRGPVTGW